MWCPLDNEKQNGMPCFRKLSKASWVTLWCHAIEASLIHRYSNIKNGCAQELGGQSNATNWRKVLAERLLNTAVHQAKIRDDLITCFVVVLAQASQLALQTSLKLLRYLNDIKEVENASRVPPVMLLPLLTSAAYDYICDGCCREIARGRNTTHP